MVSMVFTRVHSQILCPLVEFLHVDDQEDTGGWPGHPWPLMYSTLTQHI